MPASAILSIPQAAALPSSTNIQNAVNSYNRNDGVGAPAFAYNNGSGGIGTAFNVSTLSLTTVSDGNGLVLGLTTGTSPVANGSIGVFTFAAPYAIAPIISVEAANQATANLPTCGAYPAGITTTGFQLNNCGGALTGATAYKWQIIIRG